MRNHVRALLTAWPSLIAAPPNVLESLADVVPDAADRFPLPEGREPGAAAMAQAGRAVARWVRARGAHLLHGHGLRLLPLFTAASLASGLPLIVTLHNLVPELSPAASAALRTLFLCPRFVVSVSAAVARSARSLVPAARLRVVANGTDLARFSAEVLPAREAARKLLDLSPEARIALCIARLSPEKDVANFLEAAALVAPRLPEARFIIAGDGDLLPTLRWQSRLLGLNGRADFLGRRDDIPALLAASDLLCLPSREEGLSLALLEAMAAGLPVVATRVGGSPEAIVEGETGLLVPPRDPAALAAVLEAVLGNPQWAATMGRAGRVRAAECFSLEQMLRETAALYAEADCR